SGAALTYASFANPMANVRLQRSASDPSPGSFIFAPAAPGSAQAADLRGTFWNIVVADSCTSNSQCPATSTCTDGACVHACTSSSDCTTAGALCVQGSCSDVEGGILLYIADVETDRHSNLSKYPA